jgi:hypothetical protein
VLATTEQPRISYRVPVALAFSANLCPGCGPVADELSSRFCGQHGAMLRESLAIWRAQRAQASG